jgi:hypothetical protein
MALFGTTSCDVSNLLGLFLPPIDIGTVEIGTEGDPRLFCLVIRTMCTNG